MEKTPTARLSEAGWIKVQTSRECGEALHASGNLNGLACGRRAAWTDAARTQPVRCAQHAAEHI